MNTRLPRRSRSVIRRMGMGSDYPFKGETREGTGRPEPDTQPVRLRALAPRIALRYLAFINATVVSSMRLLNPHSLSYQSIP